MIAPDNALSIFKYNGDKTPVRIVIDEHGEPWFVASDVCQILGLDNVSKAISRLDDDEKANITSSDVDGRPHKFLAVNESGLYSLILTSRKPEAKRFKKWITGEVLPSLRKAGQYSIKELDPLDQLKLTVTILEQQRSEMRLLQAQQTELNTRVELIEDTYQADQGQPRMMTVAAYATFRQLHLTGGEIAAAGRRAKLYSDVHGYPIEAIAHKVYGKVNAYHIDVLREVFKQRGFFEGRPQ